MKPNTQMRKTMLLYHKFKKLKCDGAPILSGGDDGQGTTQVSVMKKRRLFKIAEVKKGKISYYFK